MESQSKTTYLPTDFTETHQSHDLKLLFTIYNLINDYKSNKATSLPETLEKIGFFAQRVSFRDKDYERIRNKYGYIQRHKHNKINPSGIPFEDLYLLHILYKHHKLSIIPEEEVILIKNLESLQNKISFILKTEARILTSEALFSDPAIQNIISLWKNQPDSLKDLQLFVKKKYTRFVLENIKAESALLYRPLDLLKRQDRYLTVRLLHKFGEWSHQFLVGTKVDLEPELDMESLKLLNDIRDNLKKVVMRLDSPLSEDPEIIKKSQEAVSNVFLIFSKLGEASYDPKTLHEELKNVRKYLLVSGTVEKDLEKYNKKKTEKVIEEERMLKLKSLASLNAMVRAAEKLFDTASLLNKYQKEYYILLAKVDNPNGFPEKLYIEQREYIKEIIAKHQNEEEGSPMAKMITILTRAMKKIDQHEAGAEGKFNELQEKYQEELLKFEENYGIEHDYPKELSPSNEKEIKEKVRRLKNETFQTVEKQREVAFTEYDQKNIVKYMEKVMMELEYVASLLPLYNEQVERILELLVCVIADLLREVGDLLRDEKLMCFSENVRSLVKILIKTRNQLCHDTFLVDYELFLRIVKDTIACSEEFRNFYFRENSKIPSEKIENNK